MEVNCGIYIYISLSTPGTLSPRLDSNTRRLCVGYAVVKDKKPESIAVLKEIVNDSTRRMHRNKVLRAITSSFLRRAEICATNGDSHFETEL